MMRRIIDDLRGYVHEVDVSEVTGLGPWLVTGLPEWSPACCVTDSGAVRFFEAEEEL